MKGSVAESPKATPYTGERGSSFLDYSDSAFSLSIIIQVSFQLFVIPGSHFSYTAVMFSNSSVIALIVLTGSPQYIMGFTTKANQGSLSLLAFLTPLNTSGTLGFHYLFGIILLICHILRKKLLK